MLPEQHHLLDAIKLCYNILNHRCDTDILFAILDRSMMIFDIREDDNNNWLNVIKPKVYRDVSMPLIQKVQWLVDIRIEINIEDLDPKF